jgi:hypothetical protein
MSMHIKPLAPIEEAGLRAHGLPVGTPSQLADAFRLGMAWSDKARAEASLAEPQPDADGPWKSAVIDQLVIAHILTAEHENDPLKAIQDLLAYHTDIAVDPRVSGAAAKLVEQSKAEEREACAHEGWMAASWDCEDRVKAAILARGQK